MTASLALLVAFATNQPFALIALFLFLFVALCLANRPNLASLALIGSVVAFALQYI